MSEDKLDKIMQYLENLDKRISTMENVLSTRKSEVAIFTEESSQEKTREESFIEFFKKFHPVKETDKTLVIMYFLEIRKGIKNITTKDISEGFKEVREKVPMNVADKIQLLHKKGLIMPAEMVNTLKGWMITQSGLTYLEELKDE